MTDWVKALSIAILLIGGVLLTPIILTLFAGILLFAGITVTVWFCIQVLKDD